MDRESALESEPEKARATIPNGRPTGSSDDELRRQLRARLAEGGLPSVDGVSQSHRGTGRSCIVCRLATEPTDVEREVKDGSGIVLTAHEACYKPWLEESRAWRDTFRERRGHPGRAPRAGALSR
jgi:hypothetical protein